MTTTIAYHLDYPLSLVALLSLTVLSLQLALNADLAFSEQLARGVYIARRMDISCSTGALLKQSALFALYCTLIQQ